MSTSSLRLELPDPAATEALGAALARVLQAPERGTLGGVIHLRGELGAGKTLLARSLLRAMGVRETIRSPTYTLLDTYLVGDWICVHVDLYRLQSRSEVDELDLRDLVGPSTLLLVEWPERGFGALPPADAEVALNYAGDARRAALSFHTPLAGAWSLELGRDSRLSPYLSN